VKKTEKEVKVKEVKVEKQRRRPVLFRDDLEILNTVGEQIRLARLRRKISVEIVADRAGISRTTVWKVERGDPSVAIGIYAKVLKAIGLEADLKLIARDDELGRLLQDLELERRRNRKE